MTFNKLNLFTLDYNVFNEILNNQLETVKSSKYLYNYSFLHRKVLKDSHKLTMVKRLITSGFYDINLAEKNL
jgi:hypothetical protein